MNIAALAASFAVMDITSLARFILNAECKSIVVLTGAGVSVASGIPDFRSPGGMYDTLRPELITANTEERRLMRIYPTSVVSWYIFRENAFPYLEVRRPFILGTQERQWRATIAHRFVELLHTKTKKLTRLYTQNIDGLDRQCDKIPPEKIVEVHGTMSRAECEGCGNEMDYTTFCEQVRTNIKDIYAEGVDSTTGNNNNNNNINSNHESTPIPCPHCNKPLVKPCTVLFGRSLPAEFFDKAKQDLPHADLLIIAGTSLVVSPANSLVSRVPESTIRVIVNTEPVGEELGIDYAKNNSANDDTNDNNERTPGATTAKQSRDFFAQGECDEVFLRLIQELGWLDDLKAQIHELPPRSQQLLENIV